MAAPGAKSDLYNCLGVYVDRVIEPPPLCVFFCTHTHMLSYIGREKSTTAETLIALSVFERSFEGSVSGSLCCTLNEHMQR